MRSAVGALGLIIALGGHVGAARTGPDAGPQRLAIVVGVNTPRDARLPTLRYADDDALRYAQLFERLGVRSVLLTVMDEETARARPALAERARQPTLAGLDEAWRQVNTLAALGRERGRRTDLLFVYAGHGERGPEGAGRLHMQDGYLTQAALLAALKASKADFNHVIIDACHASSVVFRRGAEDGYSPEGYDATVARYFAAEDIRALPNTGVVLASSSDEATHEWSALRAGVFSHEVRSALSGAADVNGDGLIEYSELGAYVAAANAAVSVRAARPTVVIQAPKLYPNRAMVDVISPRSAYVELPAGWSGHAWLEDAAGNRAVDLHPSGEAPVRISLAPGRSWFLRRAGFEQRLALSARRLTRVDEGAWSPVGVGARGAVNEAFRRELFTVPFGVAFYRGFMAQSGGVEARAQRAIPALEEISAPARLGPWAWAGVSLASGTLVGAAVTGYLARSAYDDFSAGLAATGQDDRGERRRIAGLRDWSNGLLIAGGVVAGGALTLFLLDDESHLRVEGTPGGLRVGGRF